MKEEFLHYIWKYRHFDPYQLIADTGEMVEVIDTGEHNPNAGPDFLNARLKIGDTLWAGNVEVHLRSSDWHRHNHGNDEAFRNVILQVVETIDRAAIEHGQTIIPTVKLVYNPKLLENYTELVRREKKAPCSHKIGQVNSIYLDKWLETLAIERLEQKTAIMASTLSHLQNDWSEALYRHLARNFGFKVNSDAFAALAESLPLRYLAKHHNNLLHLEAMLFGQAGLLENPNDDDYQRQLQDEYRHLAAKFNLTPLPAKMFRFMRLRPENFPTIRIAQFAGLIHKSSGLFSKLMETEDKKGLEALFDVGASAYWHSHYLFGKASLRQKQARLGKVAFYNLVINTVAPFLFLYGQFQSNEALMERALLFLQDMPSEENAIIRTWKEAGILPRNALESQALIQLKNRYCLGPRCLECAIGHRLIAIG